MEFNIEKYHLKSSSLLELLSEDDSRRIKTKIIRKEYVKGEYLFKEKSFSKGVYIVRKGKIKIFQTNGDGKQSVVYIYKKGEFFGYRPLLAEEPHPVSALAMDGVVISFISRDIFLDLLTKSPSFARKIAISLAKEFSVWINKMTLFSHYSLKERVALSLLILNKVYQNDESGSKSAVIAINRDDFAAFVGTAKETLVRMLRVFKDEKIITARGTKIIINKPKALIEVVSSI